MTTPEEKEMSQLLDMYVASLPDKDRQAYMIAKSHLGSSFNLRRSNGFQEFIKKKNAERETKNT